MTNYLTPMGSSGRSRLSASERRDLASIRKELVKSEMAFAAIDHLARKGMVGQAKLCDEGRSYASGDPYVGSQMQMWISWSQITKMDEASDAVCRWRRY